jgi:hypothetical protein
MSLIIINNSAGKLKVGGAAILDINTKNHNNGTLYDQAKTPLINKILRELIVWYSSWVIRNIAEEVAPWAIIRATPPTIPKLEATERAAKTIPIWLTEEKAIIIFKSVRRRHRILIKNLPTNEIDNQGSIEFQDQHTGMNNQSPYLPNFKRIAAKTMDPKTGASTWALGSHTWTPNIGNLTAKASKNTREIIHFLMDSLILEKFVKIFTENKLQFSLIINSKRRKGREAANV